LNYTRDAIPCVPCFSQADWLKENLNDKMRPLQGMGSRQEGLQQMKIIRECEKLRCPRRSQALASASPAFCHGRSRFAMDY